MGGCFALRLLREERIPRALPRLGLVAALIAVLNAGVWIRNLKTYGGLYGPREWISSNLTITEIINLLGGKSTSPGLFEEAQGDSSSGTDLLPRAGKLAPWPVSRVAQAAALNLVTPSLFVNQTAWNVVDAFPGLFDNIVDNSLRNAAWSHEDTAGNPLHLFLVIVTGAAVLAKGSRDADERRLRRYALAVGLTFIILPCVVRQASVDYGVRYQLPFFVLWAPIVGLVAGEPRRDAYGKGLGRLLLVSAMPYALMNNTRPVIGHPPWPIRAQSMLKPSTEDLLFLPLILTVKASCWRWAGELERAAARMSVSVSTRGTLSTSSGGFWVRPIAESDSSHSSPTRAWSSCSIQTSSHVQQSARFAEIARLSMV